MPVDLPDRIVLRPVAAPVPGVRPAALAAGRAITIVDDGGGVGLSLAALLEGHGLKTTLVSTASGVEPDTDGVIYLRGLRDFSNIEEGTSIVKDAFDAARAVAVGSPDHPGKLGNRNFTRPAPGVGEHTSSQVTGCGVLTRTGRTP